MRLRSEIEKERAGENVIVELLLDIRELMLKEKKVKQP